MRISDWSSDVCSSDLEQLQVLQAPAMADAALPGDADDLVAPARDALAELARRQRRLGQRLARFEVEASDARPAILAGAFIQLADVPDPPLGEAALIVGIGATDAVKMRRSAGREGG